MVVDDELLKNLSGVLALFAIAVTFILTYTPRKG
jgi:hypothetical protein